MAFNPFIAFYQTTCTPHFLLTVIFISVAIKSFFLTQLIPYGFKLKTIRTPWLFLIGTLLGSFFGDIAWIGKLMQILNLLPCIPADKMHTIVTFFIRIAWGSVILQYQSLALFVQSLTQKQFTLSRSQKLFIMISCTIALYFFYIAFFSPPTLSEHERDMIHNLVNPPLEIKIMRYIPFYLLTLLLLPSMSLYFFKNKIYNLPKILKKQLRIFIICLLLPYIIIELFQALFMLFVQIKSFLYPTVGISTLLLNYALYYCFNKVMQLRFLNGSQHIDNTTSPVHFIGHFKNVLEQLGQAHKLQELKHISQTFFKESLAIPLQSTIFHIAPSHDTEQLPLHTKHTSTHIIYLAQQFIDQCHPDILNFLYEKKICIYDDIAFENFYEKNEQKIIILDFLHAIEADIFLPIFKQNTIIAYIIVKRHARLNECFNKTERDQMIVFATYLSNVINLFQNRNIDMLIQKERQLKDELYYKHQEINLFTQSIRSFLSETNHCPIGIIFYKNNQFSYGNQSAKELLAIDLNEQIGDPLVKTMKKIALQVITYKSPHTVHTYDSKGAPIVLSGMHHLEHNYVFITITWPDISDVISVHAHKLYNPTDWDYLLYLQTTAAGALINSFIPAYTPQLLHVKINLLKKGLGNKALLLNVVDEDLHAVAHILHTMSGNESFYTLNITNHEQHNAIGIQLFGKNSIGENQLNNPCLLEKLHKSSTLLIQNIHLLMPETQTSLADFIRSGYFRAINSEQKKESYTRILCTAHQPHNTHKNIAHKELSDIFNEHKITIPPLHMLADEEISDLIDGYVHQLTQKHSYARLIALTHKEKQLIINKCPASITQLQHKIENIFIKKSKQNNLDHDIISDTISRLESSPVEHAARLGKKALKDEKIMQFLWDTFKSNHKIANLLGVNRSSVYKRCKKYNLDQYSGD